MLYVNRFDDHINLGTNPDEDREFCKQLLCAWRHDVGNVFAESQVMFGKINQYKTSIFSDPTDKKEDCRGLLYEIDMHRTELSKTFDQLDLIGFDGTNRVIIALDKQFHAYMKDLKQDCLGLQTPVIRPPLNQLGTSPLRELLDDISNVATSKCRYLKGIIEDKLKRIWSR